jgi:OPT family oligopeptide transporter
LLAVAAIGVVLVLGWRVFGLHPLLVLLALVLAFVLSIVSTRATGETDQAPIGAMGGLSQILTAAAAPGRPHVTLASGAVVNGMAAHAAQMAWSFRAGHLLGSQPRRLIWSQLLGAVVGAVVVVPAYVLVVRAYGLGTKAMPAPSPLSWKATAVLVEGGVGALPRYALLAAAIGGAFGVALTVGARFRLGRWLPSAVALGTAFVIPASYSVSICLGGLLLWVSQKRDARWTDSYGSSIAGGLIAGESLVGILIAVLTVTGALR